MGQEYKKCLLVGSFLDTAKTKGNISAIGKTKSFILGTAKTKAFILGSAKTKAFIKAPLNIEKTKQNKMLDCFPSFLKICY